ncbi:MAG: SOS response-associated peptidase [Chloroflexi bacterium]|nr:SOS response-associated peptidase [Chloroflexota bacterium]
MCGRFTLTVDADTIHDAFPWLEVPGNLTPRYNIAPTQPVAVVPNNGQNRLDAFVWGLIPAWAKDPSIGNKLINARGETLAEKPSFRGAYKRRRCLVLADGFYEWVKQPGRAKTPHYIQLESKEPFAFAGLWELWHAPDGSEVYSTTIITTEPNEMIGRLHNRMPVILPPAAYEQWLDPAEQTADKLQPLLRPYPAGEMMHYPVSTLVNSPFNDVPEVLRPAA